MRTEDLVLNNQRKVKIDVSELKQFTELTKKTLDLEDRRLSVVFVSDRRMKELNDFFRGRNSTTDVLSFPYQADAFDNDPSNLGDIVISAEQAVLQAEENGLTLENEIKQLILHGLLHLCGHDHETDNGEMNARELELRDKLGI